MIFTVPEECICIWETYDPLHPHKWGVCQIYVGCSNPRWSLPSQKSAFEFERCTMRMHLNEDFCQIYVGCSNPRRLLPSPKNAFAFERRTMRMRLYDPLRPHFVKSMLVVAILEDLCLLRRVHLHLRDVQWEYVCTTHCGHTNKDFVKSMLVVAILC